MGKLICGSNPDTLYPYFNTCCDDRISIFFSTPGRRWVEGGSNIDISVVPVGISNMDWSMDSGQWTVVDCVIGKKRHHIDTQYFSLPGEGISIFNKNNIFGISTRIIKIILLPVVATALA